MYTGKGIGHHHERAGFTARDTGKIQEEDMCGCREGGKLLIKN